MDISVFSSGGFGAGGGGHAGGGLGNLADELADAGLSDGEDEDYDNASGPADISLDYPNGVAQQGKEGARDSGVDVESPTGTGRGERAKNKNLILPSVNGSGYHRAASEYDGSEYGSESDLESTNMPPSLVARIDAVESLARRGTEHTGSATDGAFKRVTEGLRDLGSQSGVEGGASRLITAHSALTTHLSHQTRQLHNLSFPLFSPLVPPPDPETIDGLLPMLTSLSESIPRPTTSAFSSLTALHTITSDLLENFCNERYDPDSSRLHKAGAAQKKTDRSTLQRKQRG
ncbi:hypothetical protein P8C59_007935 [Phyllachora maydis]|uniref:Uncharacterized protein n=1 Tax=Phyllachora maydis TaxID=1825666 RepID=A0AAD9I9J8_9PEZI|nr:hypothetical protein P8C59_007935 [Phyllachora maydis]